MFRRMIMATGLSLAEFARKTQMSPQMLNAKLRSQTLAFLFLIAKTLNAKVVFEYPDGMKLDLTQFADEFVFTKRPYAGRHCKEG